MIEAIMLKLFVTGVFLGLLFAGFNLFGAALYDIVGTYRSKRLRPYGKVRRYRPLISIIIPAHNEQATIERALDALLKSSYRKFEVIIGDDLSDDQTKPILRRYIANHPKHSIRLVAKRKWGGRGAAIDAALRHAKGELVMALDADCVVDRHALRNMARHFADPGTAAVAANIHLMDTGNMVSLLQVFDYLISFRSKKFNTLTNCEYIIGGAGATYRRAIIKQLGGFDHSMKTEDIEMSLRIVNVLGNKKVGLKYAGDVMITTEPVPSYKSLYRQRYRWKFGSLQALFKHRQLFFSLRRRHSKLLTFVRLPFVLWSEMMLLLEPVYFGYFLFQAIANHNATLFASASIVMTVLAGLAIWSDEHLEVGTRIRLTLLAPMMYAVFFSMTAIQIVAAAKSMINLRSLTGKKSVVGSYISPERLGGQVQAKAG
jgi:cellulose synthase/poly-beta-1,6-N-acetylglucosamine synthase-like glycosyltransferase